MGSVKKSVKNFAKKNSLKVKPESGGKREILLGKPQPKQEEFFCAKERFVAYGGARGGGKSWAARTKAIMLALSQNGIQILFLRRTLASLRENHIYPMKKILKDVA